jgi:uncharacterized protein involved in outer membrane biogenesis
MHPTIRRFLTGKYFLFSVGALLLYTLVGFFALPFAIGWYVPKLAHDQLRCQVSLGKVRINPFLMSVEVNDFSLAQSDGAPLAGFERLFLDLEPSGVFSHTARFSEFRLEKPNIHVVFEANGEINFAKLAPKSAASEPKPPTSSEPMRLLLRTVAIAGGEVTVTDKRLSVPATLQFCDLNLIFETLSTIRDQSGTYSLSTTTQKGETFQLQGAIGLAPFRSSGLLTCLNIQKATLWEFMRDNLRLEPPAGKIDVSTEYLIDAGSTPLQMALENFKVSLSGASLQLVETDRPFFELSKLDVDSVRFDLATKTIQVGKILVDGGTLRIRVDDRGMSNLQKIVRKAVTEEKKEVTPVPGMVQEHQASPPDTALWTVNLEAIEVKNIAFDLEDMSRVLPLAAGVSSIMISSKAKIEAGSKTTQVLIQQLAVELKDARVGNKEAPDPLFAANRFFIEGGEVDLRARTLTVSRVGLSDGRIEVSRERDGKLNLEKLFASKILVPGEPEVKEAPADSGPPWKYLVKNFELSGFRSALFDRAANAEKPLYQLQGLQMRVSDIDGRSPMGIECGFGTAQGGAVTLQGRVDPTVPSVEANIKVNDFPLMPFQPYLEPYITLVLQSAFVSTDGALRYGIPNTGSKIAYDGSFSLDKLSLNEAGSKETFLGWAALQIPRMKLNVEPNNFRIEEVRLKKLLGQLIIAEDRTVNLAKIVKEQPAKESAPPALSPESNKKGVSSAKAPQKDPIKPQGEESGGAFPFSIGKVRVEDGNMVFADLSLKPKFTTRIHSLKGMVSRLSSSGDALAEIQLDGGVDQYGFVKITGALDLHDIKRSTEVSLVFQNVELTSVTPYSGKFAGRSIKSGKLSMNLEYKIQKNQMIGDNKIIVDNLELGAHVDSPDAVNLPLDLAVALLKDASGKIDIGLPVSGDLNDPQFSLGPLIWKVFINLITKAVTAPFRALGALFGGSEEKFDAVAFDSGRMELLPPEKEKLKKLSDALQKRPQLRIVVQGRYSPEADGLEFKQTRVRRTVGTLAGEKLPPGEDTVPLDLGDGKTRRALEKIFEERFGKPALEELNRGVKEGTITARPVEASAPEKGRAENRSRFWKILQGAKLYKLMPGAKSPEQSELLAAEIYARLIESEPAPEQELLQLAAKRAQSVGAELENICGVPSNRITMKDPESQANDEGRSVKLSLDALASSP